MHAQMSSVDVATAASSWRSSSSSAVGIPFFTEQLCRQGGSTGSAGGLA